MTYQKGYPLIITQNNAYVGILFIHAVVLHNLHKLARRWSEWRKRVKRVGTFPNSNDFPNPWSIILCLILFCSFIHYDRQNVLVQLIKEAVMGRDALNVKYGI